MKTTIVLVLALFIFQNSNAQLFGVNKQFTNETEWRLNFKVAEAYFTKTYGYCAKCFDSLLETTNEIDGVVLRMGVECYNKSSQKDKIERLIENGLLDDVPKVKLCRLDLSAEIKALPYFDDCIEGAKSKREEVSNTPLKDTLINMLIADQYNRSIGVTNVLADRGYEVYNDYLSNNTQHYMDSVNQIELKRIIAENGFPNKEQVGHWGMQSIFLIIQHSELEYQLKHLDNITNSFENGELIGYNYATMIDRIETHQGNKQIYGTQSRMDNGTPRLSPMVDRENVNQLRMKLGMIPMERYLLLRGILDE